MINSRRSYQRHEIMSSSESRQWSIKGCKSDSQWWLPREWRRDCFHQVTWSFRKPNTLRAAARSSNCSNRTQDLIWLGPKLIKSMLLITSYRLRLASVVKAQHSQIKLCKQCGVVTIWALFANNKLLSLRKRAKCWRRLRKRMMLKKWKHRLKRTIAFEWLRRRLGRSQIRLQHRSGPKSAIKRMKQSSLKS